LSARQRPIGVKLLTILQILLGILFLLGALAIGVAGFGLPEVFPHFRFLPVRLFTVAAVLFVLAAIEYVLGFGVWSGKGWAWSASLAFAIFSVVFFVFSLFLRPGLGELASLVIDLLVLYYLMQPKVQAYFGKGAARHNSS
jgi:uncharacterized membrane protein (DUF2068 family)